MLYKFKIDYNTAEAMKNIYWGKAESAIDHSTVTRWFKKFCLNCKNCKPYRQTRRVSGELGILQSRVIRHIHNYSKIIWICGIVAHITNILQNFWLILVPTQSARAVEYTGCISAEG